MFGAKKRLKRMVESFFGKNTLECYSYYNAENRLHHIERFHEGISDFETHHWEVDDITWNDLEMDRVFLRMNHTNSFIGSIRGKVKIQMRLHCFRIWNILTVSWKWQRGI